jgi:hypothetical protein
MVLNFLAVTNVVTIEVVAITVIAVAVTCNTVVVT